MCWRRGGSQKTCPGGLRESQQRLVGLRHTAFEWMQSLFQLVFNVSSSLLKE